MDSTTLSHWTFENRLTYCMKKGQLDYERLRTEINVRVLEQLKSLSRTIAPLLYVPTPRG